LNVCQKLHKLLKSKIYHIKHLKMEKLL